jgi:hypothetical protein
MERKVEAVHSSTNRVGPSVQLNVQQQCIVEDYRLHGVSDEQQCLDTVHASVCIHIMQKSLGLFWAQGSVFHGEA